MAIDVEGPINGMLGALSVGVVAKVVTDTTGSMFNSIARPQARRPIAPRPGRMVKKLQSKESEKYYRINRAGEVKAKAFGVGGPTGFGKAWNGDFSNIGF